ncbi:D-2-hydroxyacid dehydrogenase [Paenibacillus glufosinatiresistens]|uniref:D-2-hydroxyacid dehydrogenase n=1 Tax=Paenibacillus glufosinatiresistens TaxID=3070657 RepID=UPI00286DF47B|nr:D-2-hydroxyacid dehydrogenase [Paenibacillus sp. YX.27]
MSRLIVSLHALNEKQKSLILEAAPGYRLEETRADSPDPALLAQAEILIGWGKGIAGHVLAEGTPLRWVQSWSAGIDRMPLDRLRERGVFLTNASGVHAEPIASVIIGFMLLFVRDFHTAVRNQERRLWQSSGAESELTGKTAVIAGTGRIGAETARLAKAFRMKTVGIRSKAEPVPGFDEIRTTGQLREAAAEADFVINTLPLTDRTRGLFDASVFSAFKPGAYYISIGRGGTTVTDDLIAALHSRRLAGAGLDVFEQEPLPADHPLWAMEQVVITPHSAGNTDRYADRMADIFAGNLKAYAATGTPDLNLVDYERQY